jgi:hypothetical protein
MRTVPLAGIEPALLAGAFADFPGKDSKPHSYRTTIKCTVTVMLIKRMARRTLLPRSSG